MPQGPDKSPAAQAPAAAHKASPMDPAHVMDWAPLHLGHPTVSSRSVSLIDLDVQVFGLDEIQGSSRPIAVVIVSHGWANKAKDMHPMASGLIGEANRLDAAGGRRRTRDVLVVTVDARNHGTRRRVKDNLAYHERPRQYAVYMSMAVTGGVQDQQLIMDFLPAMLFPSDEREVVDWMVTGFSMGGHVCWRLLRFDPRVRIGVPICSVPSEVLGFRLLTSPLPPGTAESPVGKDVRAYFNEPCAPGAYAGKKILSIYGGMDNVMPWGLSAQRWDAISREADAADRFVDYDFGHVVSPAMVERTAEWLWRWGLTAAA